MWQRRPEIPSQQVTIGPALMEGVERTNAVMMREQEQGIGPLRRDLYTIEVNRRRKCYTCREFGYMACHCRNQERTRVAGGRRLEYVGGSFEGNHKHLNCLKEEECQDRRKWTYFIFDLFFHFSIFRTTRVRVDRSRCHTSHNLMA